MKNRLLLFILCGALVTACSENRSHPEETTKQQQGSNPIPKQQGNDPMPQAQAPVSIAPVKPRQNVTHAQSVEPLPAKSLQAMLPDIIAGVRGTEPSSGSLNEQGVHWTTASRDYTGPVGNFTVTLTDFTDIQDIISPFENEYNIMPSDVVGDISHFETPNGRGVIVWNPSKREGKLVFSVKGRFEVRIRTSALPPDVASLRKVFDALPVSKLARAS